MQVSSHLHVRTRDQHGGNYFSFLEHVDDVALEIFTAVRLQVAAPKRTRGERIKSYKKKKKKLATIIKYKAAAGMLAALNQSLRRRMQALLYSRDGDERGGPAATHREDETWPADIWASRFTGQRLQLKPKLLLPLEVSDPLLPNSTVAPVDGGE